MTLLAGKNITKQEKKMDILKICIDESWNINISAHWTFYLLGLILLIIWFFNFFKTQQLFNKNIEIDSAEIGIQGQKIKIKPNYTNINIAYQIWVELNTRKIGMKIDFENDVIIEVYNSWHQFFRITRDLIKSLPATKIRSNRDSKELIVISTKILNEGLRPHLTVWQAKFRRWYLLAEDLKENKNKTPQQIQCNYPDYELLKTDMIKVNNNIIRYKNIIYELAFGEKV